MALGGLKFIKYALNLILNILKNIPLSFGKSDFGESIGLTNLENI